MQENGAINITTLMGKHRYLCVEIHSNKLRNCRQQHTHKQHQQSITVALVKQNMVMSEAFTNSASFSGGEQPRCRPLSRRQMCARRMWRSSGWECSCDSCAVCDGAGCGIGGGGSKDCIYLRASIKLM